MSHRTDLDGRAAHPASMNLSSFITTNLDAILAEWERFARTLLPSAATMDSLALRDHARQILEAVAKDIVVPQTAAESDSKSRGTEDSEEIDTAAAVHGSLRHTAGFDLRQLFAEYRALRASVLRMWSEHGGDASAHAVSQMTRFNEAIDQALAESVARFSDDVGRSRDTLVAVLGHDLRSPLQAVSASVGTLADETQTEAARAAALARIRASVLGMSQMIRDLLEYTRTSLGGVFPINAVAANVEAIVRESLEEVMAGHPQRSFRMETAKDLHARVDPARLQQAITNLLGNAIEHGKRGSVIELVARKSDGSLTIDVSNEGPAIPADALQVIFDPLRRAKAADSRPNGPARPGLGLFIAREIAQGHGGTIEAQSSERRTTFTIRIPLRSEKTGQAAALPAAA
ncbi:MAG TPA: sensor histidine kinase [Usitatibacter sp.]|nr:sensor histidine kinase [Usitatibacter sp.]